MAEVTPIWFTARAAGTAALVLASLSVAFGLLHAARVLPRRIGAGESRAVHEALGLATLAAVAVHGLALLLDPILKAGLLDLAIPFAVGYKPFATGLGQIAGLGMAALALSYYARRRVGPGRWRSAHRLIPAFWALAVAHGLLSGTDAGEPWFLVAVGAPVLGALALLVRQAGAASAAPAVQRGSPSSPRA